MKALRIIIIILLVLAGVLLIGALFMPTELNIKKTQLLTAKADVIFPQVNCLKNWELWAIWNKDTNMVSVYEGSECGVGCKHSWTYRNMDEAGSQTIVESKENQFVRTDLDFSGMGIAKITFSLEETGNGTLVTWTMQYGSSYPFGRWINAIFVKPMVEKSYEDGLNNLEALTKDMKPKPKWRTGEITETVTSARPSLTITSSVTAQDISAKMGENFGALMKCIGENKGSMAGFPFAIFHKFDVQGEIVMECGIPLAAPVKSSGEIKAVSTYAGKVVSVMHYGPYETSEASWNAIKEYIAAKNLTTNGSPWEVYTNDPKMEPDQSKWETQISFPVK